MPELNRTTHISFPDVTGYEDITEGIASGSLALDEILLSGNLNFGEVNSNKFEVQLYGIENVANQRIMVWAVEDEGTPEEVEYPLFSGYVDSCKQDNMSYYRNIVAYDALYYKGDINVANWWTNFWANEDSATLATLRESLCQFVDIETVSGTYFNDNLTIYKAVSMTNVSFRDLLGQICQLQCVFPNINREGKLEFISLDMSSSVDLRESYKKASSSFEDYVTRKVDAVSIIGPNDAVVGTTDPGNTAKNKYLIQGNIFAYGIAEGTEATVAQTYLNHIKDLQYVPMKLEMINSELGYDLGQYIQTDKGYSFILSNSLSGSMLVEESIESKGDEYLSGTQRSYNSDITALRAQVETLTDDTIANALVSYQATNANAPKVITDTWVKVLDFTDFNVITTEVTDLIFMANLNLTASSSEVVTAESKTTTPAAVEVRYVLNDGIIDYHPKQDYEDGKYILPLNYQIVNVPPITRINFSVWLKADTGMVTINAGDAIGYLMGQRLKLNEITHIEADLSGMMKNFPHSTLTFDGLVINGVYENGDEEDVTDQCTFEPTSGTAIDFETESIDVTATFGDHTTDFTVEISPMFKVYGKSNTNLGISNVERIEKVGDQYFALADRVGYQNNTKTLYLAYTNILLDQSGRPTWSTIKSGWQAAFPAVNASDQQVDQVRVGNKWYADGCISGISTIKWFDLETLQDGSITATIHDPGTYPAAITSIRTSGNYNYAVLIDGYILYPDLDVYISGYSSARGGIAYAVPGNGTYDIYVVARAGYEDKPVTVDSYRARGTGTSVIIEQAHFDPTNLLTYQTIVEIPEALSISASFTGYKIAGTSSVYVFQSGSYKFVVDVSTGEYKVFSTGDAITRILERTTYDADQGIYFTLFRDTQVTYTYRTHMMYISYDLETWYHGGYLAPVGWDDNFNLNDSTYLLKNGDYWVGAVNPVDMYDTPFSMHFETDLSQ